MELRKEAPLTLTRQQSSSLTTMATEQQNPDNKKDKGPMRPALFVGLGSTGSKIVSKIKHNIKRDGEELAKQFHRYLNVVTDVTAEPGVDEDIDSIVLTSNGLSSSAVVNSFWQPMGGANTDTIRSSFAGWWYPEIGSTGSYQPWIPPVGGLERGAGGVRPLGRLLLHYHCLNGGVVARLTTIVESIRKQRQDLKQEDQQQVEDQQLECYLFGLLAGGTCSGIFMDFAWLLRKAMNELSIQGSINGVFLLGDVCYQNVSHGNSNPMRQRTQRENTLHALAELSLLHTAKGRSIIATEAPRIIGREVLEEAIFKASPFHQVSFVGAVNDRGHKLPTFEGYQDMVADFVSNLFATELHTIEVGRAIDEEAGHRLGPERSWPTRPLSFRRLGMVVLRTPSEKIFALVKHALSNEIAVNAFKNATAEQADAAVTKFQNAIGWHSLLEAFTPPLDEILPEEEEPLPGKAEDYKASWLDRKKDVERFYGAWDQFTSAESGAAWHSFQSNLSNAESDLISSTTGMAAGSSFSMGNLKYALKTLLDLTDSLLATLEANRQSLDQDIYSPQGTNLQKRFEDALTEAVGEFPSGLLAPLKRASFIADENADVRYALGAYRDSLRDFVAAKRCMQALAALREALVTLEVSRALVCGPLGVEPVFQKAHRDLTTQFSTSRKMTTDVELLDSQEDVERVFVRPLLAEAASQSSSQSRQETAVSRTLLAWKSRSGELFPDAFCSLVGKVRSNQRARTVEFALQSEDISLAVSNLSRGFADHFDAVVDEVFGEPARDISAWQALEKYVCQCQAPPKQVLQDLFKSYYEYVRLFPKLSDDASMDRYEFSSKSFYLCNTDDAKRCFANLGIDNPNSFLQELLRHVLGGELTALPDETKRDRIVLLLSKEGELPFFYKGFRSLRGLMRNPPANRSGGLGWTDRRFPEWIKRWHEESPDGQKPQIPG